MDNQRIILLKITGEALPSAIASASAIDSALLIRAIAQQISALKETHKFAIVIGAGNIFRGSIQGKQLGIRESVSHQVGMLATMLNGLIIKELFDQEGIKTKLLTALDCPSVGDIISPSAISQAHAQNNCIIFTGGTGAPYFTTDTAAIVRGLQIGAHEIWKATNVDGVYSDNPHKNPRAKFIPRLSHQEALDQKIGIFDATALILAQERKLPIHLFNLWGKNILIDIAHKKTVGSLIS